MQYYFIDRHCPHRYRQVPRLTIQIQHDSHEDDEKESVFCAMDIGFITRYCTNNRTNLGPLLFVVVVIV